MLYFELSPAHSICSKPLSNRSTRNKYRSPSCAALQYQEYCAARSAYDLSDLWYEYVLKADVLTGHGVVRLAQTSSLCLHVYHISRYIAMLGLQRGHWEYFFVSEI